MLYLHLKLLIDRDMKKVDILNAGIMSKRTLKVFKKLKRCKALII